MKPLNATPERSADLQIVLGVIARTAAQVCEANEALILLVEGDRVAVVARYGRLPSRQKLGETYPLSADLVGNRAIKGRRTIHVRDLATVAGFKETKAFQLPLGVRTILVTPLLRRGTAIGGIAIRRTRVQPFTRKQIELLKTFADQAAIAIENARLAQELQQKSSALTKAHAEVTSALDQQTATSEILRTIATASTDVTPVFDVICRSAVRLFDAYGGAICRFDGELMHLAAVNSPSPAADERARRAYPCRPDDGRITGRAILTRGVVQIPDTEDDSFEVQRLAARDFGFRRALAVPMLSEGEVIGSIAVTGREPGLYSERQVALLQTFADQAVIAIENVRLFTELQEKNEALTAAHAQVSEALEQQTATSEILRVISQSPTDIQPVFDTIVRNAVRLCGAIYGTAYRIDGEVIDLVAHMDLSGAGWERFRMTFPRPLRDGGVLREVFESRRLLYVPDVDEYPFSEAARAMLAANNARSLLTVPMIRQDRVVGAFSLFNQDENGFSDTRIALVQTFADQAVIAIENVRLFAELEATNRGLTTALDQQTATSEILRSISSSLTDAQPVFNTIVQSGLRLLDGYSATMMLLRDDDRLDLVAYTSTSVEADSSLVDAFPMPLRRIPPGERAIRERRAHAVEDVESAADVTDVMRETGRARGWRSNLFVPMIRDDVALGLISITRRESGRFAADQIALLEIFAAQAVIAIENVRLFKELETRNRDLTEALDRQTATAEILRVISQAQTELQPVFEAIVDHAMRLFRALAASVLQIDGELVRLTAMRGGLPGSEQQLREQSPWPIDTPSPVGFCIAERTIVHIPDIEADRTVDEGIRALGRARGWRSILAAPIMRDGQPIGAITIQRAEAGAFSPAEIELLKTFADQAVIAIENTRLLGELRARTGQLTRSVEELTALGDVSRALSSTLDLDRVLQTIVTRASQLSGTDACSVFEYDEATEAFHLRATNNLDEEVVTLARQTPTRKGEGVQGRMAVTRQPVQVPDIGQEDAYHGPLRDILLRTGTRAVLAIPMLRENELIGGLTVNKKTPGAFSLEVIELLTTFATQSALAIQNARLFQEIANKSRQLEAASQHKSEFLANMSHELRTPLNAIIGFSEVLGERLFGELNEKQDEYVKDIHASGQHLLSLINDILDLSKIEAGRMELELTDFHLPAALDNALVLVRERAGRRAITLHMTTDERLEYVRADERKIKQVLLNLLSNAIKFTPEGGQIEVQAKPVDGSVEVSVSDTGVGIAPDDQEAIFEEFRQVGTADKKVEGTGLGLALSRKFIELHGGRIWVESQVGVGSTFTFTIPVLTGA